MKKLVTAALIVSVALTGPSQATPPIKPIFVGEGVTLGNYEASGCRTRLARTGPLQTPPAPQGLLSFIMPGMRLATGGDTPPATTASHSQPWGRVAIQNVSASSPPRVAQTEARRSLGYHHILLRDTSRPQGLAAMIHTVSVAPGRERVAALRVVNNPKPESEPTYTLTQKCEQQPERTIMRVWTDNASTAVSLRELSHCAQPQVPCNVKIPTGRAFYYHTPYYGPGITSTTSEWIDFKVLARSIARIRAS